MYEKKKKKENIKTNRRLKSSSFYLPLFFRIKLKKKKEKKNRIPRALFPSVAHDASRTPCIRQEAERTNSRADSSWNSDPLDQRYSYCVYSPPWRCTYPVGARVHTRTQHTHTHTHTRLRPRAPNHPPCVAPAMGAHDPLASNFSTEPERLRGDLLPVSYSTIGDVMQSGILEYLFLNCR